MLLTYWNEPMLNLSPTASQCLSWCTGKERMRMWTQPVRCAVSSIRHPDSQSIDKHHKTTEQTNQWNGAYGNEYGPIEHCVRQYTSANTAGCHVRCYCCDSDVWRRRMMAMCDSNVWQWYVMAMCDSDVWCVTRLTPVMKSLRWARSGCSVSSLYILE